MRFIDDLWYLFRKYSLYIDFKAEEISTEKKGIPSKILKQKIQQHKDSMH